MGPKSTVYNSSKSHKRRSPRCHPRIDSLELRRLLSTIYVDAIAPGPTHDGSSWTNAYTDLQQGLTAATSGSTIEVGQGTYKPTTSTDRTATFQLKSGVAIYGGYAGYGPSNPNARDTVNTATILSGDIGTIGSSADNSYHVVTASNTDATAVLDGFTITAGHAQGSGTNQTNGGAILNLSGSPTINQCTFTNNFGMTAGTVYNSAASPTFTNCTFSANISSGAGGAMVNTAASSPTLINCSFTGNRGLAGGAISDDSVSTSPVLIKCTFTDNVALEGGAIFDTSSASVTLTSCMFQGNQATTTDAIHSPLEGGAVAQLGGTMSATGCVFVNNGAAYGGGIFADSNSPAIPCPILDCTFSGNFAATAGGAIATSFLAVFNIANSVLWGDTVGETYLLSGSITIVDSDVQGGFTGTGNINSNPLFVRNPSPGADGELGTADDDFGNLELQATSPCIDVGSNAAVPTGTTTDLAGAPRIIDYPGVHDPGAIVDMGAYEAGIAAAITGTSSSDNYYAKLTPDGSTLDVWNSTTPTSNPNSTFTVNTLASITFNTSDGNDSLTVDFTNGMFPNIIYQAGNGTDSLSIVGTSSSTNLDVEQNSVTCGSTGISTTGNEILILNAASGSAIGLNHLTVNSPLQLPTLSHFSLTASQLSIGIGGTLDLNHSDMIVHNGNLSQITSDVTQSMLSSASTNATTLAVELNNDGHGNKLLTTFDGQTVTTTDVLVKYTYYGDTNLNGSVDANDYIAIDNGSNQNLTGWNNGDFNLDGKINGDDYTLIDNAFNTQSAVPLATVASPQLQIDKAITKAPASSVAIFQPVLQQAFDPNHRRKPSLANEIFTD